jgi:hypothetical protein
MYYLVYEIQNLVNNKIYVGVHKTDNPDDSYLGSGIAIRLAIKKYGRNKFKKTILHSFDNADDAYLTEAEIVTAEFVAQRDTYNLSTGGLGGRNHSTETRQKISEAGSGREASEETRQKLRDAATNISEETRQKLRDAATNISEETRQKLRDAATGKVMSEETRQKLRDVNIGKKQSEETRQKRKNALKKKYKITYPDGREEIVILMDWSDANGFVYRIVKAQINTGIINAGKHPVKISETRRFLIGYKIDRME